MRAAQEEEDLLAVELELAGLQVLFVLALSGLHAQHLPPLVVVLLRRRPFQFPLGSGATGRVLRRVFVHVLGKDLQLIDLAARDEEVLEVDVLRLCLPRISEAKAFQAKDVMHTASRGAGTPGTR